MGRVRAGVRQLGSPYSPARTVALPLSALVLAVLAVLGFLPSRDQRRRTPKSRFSDVPQRAKLHTTLLILAAVCSIAALVAAVCLYPRAATPARQSPHRRRPWRRSICPRPAPSARVPAFTSSMPTGPVEWVAPQGFGAYQRRTGRDSHRRSLQSPRSAEQGDDEPGRGPSLHHPGHVHRDDQRGVHDEQHDIGLITLDGDNVPQSAAVAASLPVTGVATNLQVGQQLCKFGMGSGADACGQIVEITASKVVFLASGQCGDSGGPVYHYERDGTVSAVGILIRGGDPYTPKAGCAARAKFSVAELVRPWLDKWRLTAITAPSSPADGSFRQRPLFRSASGWLRTVAVTRQRSMD